MPKLLVKPRTQGGPVHDITPASAGWRYVGFEVRDLAAGEIVEQATADRELCLVLVSGRATISAGSMSFGTLGGRTTPFEGAPAAVYVPARSSFRLVADGAAELAICSAPGTGKLPPRLISAGAMSQESRGTGTNTRHVRNILPETEPAESLLVVEVITPGGNWSSYPPHKHDSDRLPDESYLEETYYHRLSKPGGFAFQRVYTDDRSIDETMAVGDRDVVLVPRGYHPVGAPHGYDLYYLNVMAGPKRIWKFFNDPAHEWMLKR